MPFQKNAPYIPFNGVRVPALAGRRTFLQSLARPANSALINQAVNLAVNAALKKRGRAGTRTKTKSKALVTKANVAKGEGVETSFVLRNPPSMAVKTFKKINSINEVFRQASSFQAWDVGRQSVSFTNVFAQSDFNAILSQLPASTVAGNLNRRFLLDSYKGELTFSNGTNASCYVKIYDIMAKVDIDSTDVTAGIGDPASAWQTGELQQGNATGYHVIGSYPNKVDTFKQHFKIMSMKQHFMKPGDIHKHHVNINYNKIMNEARIVNSSRYGGITYFTMIVCHGTPAQTDDATPIVSTTAGQINWTQTQRFTYRYSLDNQQNSYVLPNLLPQPAVLEVVQDDGDIDVVTNA